MAKTTTKKEDFDFGTDKRGDVAMFIEKKHFNSDWELDKEAQKHCQSLKFFRMIENGVETHVHGWVEGGQIVQIG